MRSAAEFQVVADGVYFWQEYDSAVKANLSSLALRTANRCLVFIDPIPLEKNALGELIDGASPVGIILTNANHARAAESFQAHFEVPIFLHEEGAAACGFPDSRTITGDAGTVLDLQFVRIPGGPAGEIALHHPTSKLLVVGDAIIHAEPYGFSLLPKKYASDFDLMRASARRILEWDFDKIAFAHGLPIVARARPRLEQLLAS